MKMKDILPEDRPREKLLGRGVSSLTNAELIAIFIRTGTGRRNALDIAHSVMYAGEGTLAGVLNLGLEGLCAIDGIGPDKAACILAALEAGRRFFEENNGVDPRHITSPEEIFLMMIPDMKYLDHEEAWGVFLNSRNGVIKKEKLSSGSDLTTSLDYRAIIRKALSCKASTLVLVHNHPSGSPQPGREDVLATEALRKSLSAVNITLLDHVVISDGAYFSFSEDQTFYL